MSSTFMGDLSGVMPSLSTQTTASNSTNKKAGESLQMSDFLTLMVASFQNQSIDDTASISDMMNQMVQMSVVQAITNVSTLITQSTSLTYAASLVGKEVTIGQYAGGELKELLGTVTGTGTLNGEQVIFIGEDCYKLTDVMAIGRLPSQDGPEPERIGEVAERPAEVEQPSAEETQESENAEFQETQEPQEAEEAQAGTAEESLAAQEAAQPQAESAENEVEQQEELILETGFIEPSVG